MAKTQDSTLESLQNEVDFYRRNQEAVEREIRLLIQDNQKLSQQVGSLLKEKVDNTRNSDHGNNFDELQRQVTILTKERDSLHVLWQTSQKTIDALETELRTYQDYDGRGHHQSSIQEKRDLEFKLETALTDYIELENKYKELNKKTTKLESDLKDQLNSVESHIEKEKDLNEKNTELTKAAEELKKDLKREKKEKEDMKNQLLLSQKECVSLVKREAEAKSKVAEALQLFDYITGQKDQAYKKIAEMTKELSEVKHRLFNVERVAEKRLNTVLDEARDKFNEKVTDMLNHIRNLDSELVQKGLLLNKTLRENKILQAANDSYLKQQKESMKNVDPRLQIAEQRLEVMFQELASSERRNMQLNCEKQSLTMDMKRAQDSYARELKRRDWEEKLMKTECNELKLQVENLQKSLEDTHEMVNKLQSIISSKSELNQRIVSTKEEELMELNKHLENQMELNKKWKESYIEMTEKLKMRLRDFMKENKELRKRLQMPDAETTSTCNSEESL